MNVFTFVFLVYVVHQTSARLLETANLTEFNSVRYKENASMSFIFFATKNLHINVTLNEVPHVLCRVGSQAEVALHKLDDGSGQCRSGVTPFVFHELRLNLRTGSHFSIDDPRGKTVLRDMRSPVDVEIAVGEFLHALVPPRDEEGAVYVTRKMEGCPDQPLVTGQTAVSFALIGVVAVLALLLVLATVVSCILYLLVPPETIKRVLFRSGGNDPGCTALSSRIGQKDAQDTPPPPARPTNAQTPSETRTPLAKIPSVPLSPPKTAATPHQDDARRSHHDDGYDPLHDPNYDYIEANVVRPVDRAILDQELAGANPKWKQPAGGFRKKSDPQATGFRKKSDPQATGFRKLSDPPALKPAAATPAHYQPFEDDEYINLGSGFPPLQQHGRGFDPRGYPAHY